MTPEEIAALTGEQRKKLKQKLSKKRNLRDGRLGYAENVQAINDIIGQI